MEYKAKPRTAFETLSPEQKRTIDDAVAELVQQNIINLDEESQIKNIIAMSPIGELTTLTRDGVRGLEEVTDKSGNKVTFERTRDGVEVTYGRSEVREE